MDNQHTLPGGLQIVTQMPLIKLNYEEEDIYTRIIKTGFTEKEFARDGPLVKRKAKCVIQGLKEKPRTIVTYATLHRLINRLEFVSDKISTHENICEPCVLHDVTEDPDRPRYEVQLTEEFLERNRVCSSGIIILKPYNWEGGNLTGRVVGVDFEESTLEFAPSYYRAKVDTGNNRMYTVRFESSIFNFRVREQIFNYLESGVTNGATFLVYPQPQENLVPIRNYRKLRSSSIKEIPFSNDKFNDEQKNAIFGILSGCHERFPFLLHGPPGTGKTTTLVEACRLLIAGSSANRVLVCTPSNTAADLFTHELLDIAKLPPSSVFRMYSLTKSVTEQMAVELSEVSCIVTDSDGDEVYGIWPRQKLCTFRVIVSTLSASSYLTNGGMKGQFTHIFVDEAGQASEIDNLIPVVGLMTPRTKITLAGDPKQLGPVETINYFKMHNLTNSLIERFTSMKEYENDSRMMIRLRENYRSHPEIISVPSKLFYDGELTASPDALPKDTLCGWDGLPKKGFPIIWHHSTSLEIKESLIDVRVKGGHSFYNAGEVDLVAGYIERIVGELKVKPADIGVISPYKLQVRELEKKLGGMYPEILIDTVERFQGSERLVILVSTVRSGNKIGFMDCPKRFCTTITRAQQLLIVIGNYKVVEQNQHWKSFIKHCLKNGAIIGADPVDVAVAEDDDEVEIPPADIWSDDPGDDE